ncbi:MAG: 30S ribosomal protein S6 [Salinivirgaceae bacterium]|jgi:small subunit ribosomal protein S6|nr:30S ribosomal protein S6 [Salinivirgaceae bacterium]
MQNHYETVFIANPVLSGAQMKEAVTKYRDLIEAQGGSIVHEEDWGLRKLAYPIQKKSTGFYHLFEFKADPEFISKLEIEFRRDERVMRFLTMSLDKYAIEYSEKKRAKKEQAKDKKEE